jgi:hypothetical protein
VKLGDVVVVSIVVESTDVIAVGVVSINAGVTSAAVVFVLVSTGTVVLISTGTAVLVSDVVAVSTDDVVTVEDCVLSAGVTSVDDDCDDTTSDVGSVALDNVDVIEFSVVSDVSVVVVAEVNAGSVLVLSRTVVVSGATSVLAGDATAGEIPEDDTSDSVARAELVVELIVDDNSSGRLVFVVDESLTVPDSVVGNSVTAAVLASDDELAIVSSGDSELV